MAPEISVHDNHLVAYTVLAKDRRILLQTEFRDREPHEFTDVIFEEVLAYDFEGDLFGTIIFDVKEVDLSALLKEHDTMFEEGYRYGWPRGWEKAREPIETYVRRMGMRAFELSSSYGMSGWVLAQRMEKVRGEPDQRSPADAQPSLPPDGGDQ
jgi:hypothetical protein